MYIQRLRHELSDLDKLTKKLKSHESQIKQYNIDFNPIYAGIEESRTQCQTKLALMDMFKWGWGSMNKNGKDFIVFSNE